MTTSNTAEEANTGEYDVEHNVGPENECTGEGTSFSTIADNTVNIGDSSGGSSQNSADTFTDNNEEKHSAVEASNSAATTLIRGIMMILLAVNRNAIKQY
jgi:hypothetical protein